MIKAVGQVCVGGGGDRRAVPPKSPHLAASSSQAPRSWTEKCI